MTDQKYILYLLERFEKGLATETELTELDTWYHSYDKDETYTEGMTLGQENIVQQNLLAGILGKIQAKKPELAPSIRVWSRIGIAAAIATIVFGVWFFNSNREVLNQVPDDVMVNDVAPGHSGATITYDNGEVIQLDSAKTGVVVGADLKYDDGTDFGRHPELVSGSLTASTAKGQTYQFTLPDGSKVWLNADSKLAFAADLHKAKVRSVKLEGEGYFEIAKDKAHPFIVESKDQQIEVLGTHFNVNSYADEESVKTTLVEGSVRITSYATGASSSRANARDLMNSNNKGSLAALEMTKVLKPGDQAKNKNGQLSVAKVDMENIIDWKDGDFNLDGLDFRVAMRKISRWYDVEMIYNTSVPDGIKTGGWISRDSKLSDILKLIEKTGQVHFEIRGKQVYVSK